MQEIIGITKVTAPEKPDGVSDLTFVKLAREIAMEIHDLDTILTNNRVTHEQFEAIKTNSRFEQLLASAVAEWGSALNTPERVKVKAAALIEEWLPELNTRLHDGKENLDHKVKAATLAARLAGMGLTGAGVEEVGSRFSVTINLGGDKPIEILKDVTSKVIDGEVLTTE
jgi:hypothetical protein